MLKKIKGYMMPIAMTLGIVLHNQVGILNFIIPYLIFVMLLLTYINISWHDIKFTRLHFYLILIQVFASVGIYFALNPINSLLAQGVMILIVAPTATSAPVIVGMLKGNIASLTAYSIISNLSVVLLAPILFSYVGYNDLAFITSVITIASKIGFLLVVPFVLGLVLNKFAPKTTRVLKRHSSISFYLWSLALTIVTGRTVQFVIDQGKDQIGIEIIIAFAAAIVCGLQFLIGRRLGRKFNDTVAGGQGLGQKNTVLAIWMAQMYLNPLSSIAPGSYVLWQNIVNSYQVWRKRKNL
jgi:BASS family bile acid:Na+ symporter